MRRRSSHTHSPTARKGQRGGVPGFSKSNFFPKTGNGIFKKAPNFIAYGNGQAGTLQLRGNTQANYSHTHSVTDATLTPATGCGRCGRRSPCVSISGAVVSTFRTNPVVTLPNMRRFRRYSTCQQARIQAGINNVLAPHEQRHVNIFRTYDGTVTTPFTFKMCRNQRAFSARARRLHNSIEGPRRSQVQTNSDAIDPFSFTVDLNCQD